MSHGLVQLPDVVQCCRNACDGAAVLLADVAEDAGVAEGVP